MSGSPSSGFNTTTDEVLAGRDLGGLRVLVTGASGGLGLETARALAAHGASVTLACRDPEKGQRAVAHIIEEAHPGAELSVAALDLLDHGSIAAFAQDFVEKNESLDVLINNAGIMGCPLVRTAEGWESQLATNHIGHFLLTSMLVPILRAAAPARVVCLSSAGHQMGGIDFDDMHFHRRDYDKWIAYGQSKTANALFTVELDRRLAGDAVRAFAVHPGAIATDLGRYLDDEDLVFMAGTVEEVAGGFKEVAAGAATSVWAASSPELDGKGGLYLEDCGLSAPLGSDGVTTGYAEHAVDPEIAERLWLATEEMLGQSFGL